MKQINRSAISQTVDILVARGLICRQQDALDRRNIPLELTESGNALLDTIWEKNRAWMKNRMATLDERDLETLTSAMEILNNTFAGPAE